MKNLPLRILESLKAPCLGTGGLEHFGVYSWECPEDPPTPQGGTPRTLSCGRRPTSLPAPSGLCCLRNSPSLGLMQRCHRDLLSWSTGLGIWPDMAVGPDGEATLLGCPRLVTSRLLSTSTVIPTVCSHKPLRLELALYLQAISGRERRAGRLLVTPLLHAECGSGTLCMHPDRKGPSTIVVLA